MTNKAFYADPEPNGGYVEPFAVAYYFDFPHTMTVLQNNNSQVADFLGNGGTIEPYVAIIPDTSPPAKQILTTAAAFGLGISAGEITGIEAAAGFGAGLYLDVGSYLLFLDTVQADTNYYPKAYDDAASVRVIEKGLDYVLVEAKDINGAPVDPGTFNVELVRII